MKATRKVPRTPRSDGKVVMRGPLLRLRADIEQANIAKHAALEAEQRVREKARRFEQELEAQSQSSLTAQKELRKQKEAGWILTRTAIGVAVKLHRLRKEKSALEESNKELFENLRTLKERVFGVECEQEPQSELLEKRRTRERRLLEESDKMLNVLKAREAQILNLEERLRVSEANNALLHRLNNQKHDKLARLTKRKNEVHKELLDARAKLRGREGKGMTMTEANENREPQNVESLRSAPGKGVAGKVILRLQREKESLAAENRLLAIELENLRTRIRNQKR